MTQTFEWLTKGGDRRIVCDAHGVNKYGCAPRPQPEVLAYGSATASSISVAGFAAADALCGRLPNADYASEIERIRRELGELCGLTKTDIIFAASGTDAHLIAAQLADVAQVIMIESNETGSGVPAALAGKEVSGNTIEIAAVSSRMEDGNPRPTVSIDAEVEALVADAAIAGRRVLLIVTDVSKTGLIAPSADCVRDLQKRFPDIVEVLIDACQFRLAPSTFRAYLDQGFPVAITGSKFFGGPAFSGALLVPETAARRLRARALPPAVGGYSTRADWPEGWEASATLPDVANIGLLLRWEAALVELRAFYALPEEKITAFVENFAAAMRARLVADSLFAALMTPELHRATKTWDNWPTIFPFLLRHRDNAWFNREETQKIYERLRAERCQLGQPVLCGERDGIAISALRLCLSGRLIVDAVHGRGGDAIIAEAMGVLDKVVQLTL